MDGRDVIAPNEKSENNFYIVCFTYVLYIPQEDLESDENQLASGDIVCNAI